MRPDDTHGSQLPVVSTQVALVLFGGSQLRNTVALQLIMLHEPRGHELINEFGSLS